MSPRKIRSPHGVPDKSLGGAERAAFGVVLTCVSPDGLLWTLTAGGTAVEALRECCERIDAKAGAWRILCISSPVTIMRDLEGSRMRLGGRDVGRKFKPPEEMMLGKIGRLDLLERPA